MIGARPIVPQPGVPFREPPLAEHGFFTFPPPIPGLDPPGQSAPVSTHEPGGELVQKALHPSILTVDQLFRKGPQPGWFSSSVSNQRPVQFEIGAYEVPNANHYWLYDYSFEMDRQSGLFAGASVPVPGESLTGIIGFDVTVNNNQRRGVEMFQLDPTAVTAARPSFDPSTSNPSAGRGIVPQSAFDAARYTSFALTSGQGTSLLPPNRGRQGAQNGPWIWVVKGGERLAFTAVIYKPMPVPLTSIGVRHQGFLVAQGLSEAILDRVRPR